MYTIPAIPTRYNGVNFRSRLEAKWAAFFDLLGWRWDYEPVDFPGWIPDFVIYGKHKQVYVEVKPFTEIDWNVCKKIGLAVGENDMELLLLGQTIFHSNDFDGTPAIGWLREWGYWSECVLNEFDEDGNQHPIGFVHAEIGWTDRITGLHSAPPGCFSNVADFWKEAGNKVQWNPRPC